MVNDAIRICLDESIKGRLNLRNRIYKELKERYVIVACYPYSVAEVAWSIVKKHRRWHRRPYAKRQMMKVDAGEYTINGGILSLPFRKGERLLVPLRYGEYQHSFLVDSTLKRGSITMTENAIAIAFTKLTRPYAPTSRIGYDLNERSVVGSDGTLIDLSRVARLHTEYGIRRRDFYIQHPNDRRLVKKYSASSREKERVNQVLHNVAKQIVRRAKVNKQVLVLEQLKGIRFSHLRGNGDGISQRRRVSQWPFARFVSYVGYSAVWEGVPIELVKANGTSQECHKCHQRNTALRPSEREWRCPNCGAILDRDLNAAINIERRGKIPCLGEVRPGAQGIDEAVKGNEQTTAPILRAEALKSASIGQRPITSSES